MRMSEWTPEIIGFMEDASQGSDYFEKLAEIALRDLPRGSLVCDAGCGLGQLSFSMAAAGMKVHALDRNPNALSHVSRKTKEADIAPQVTPILADFGQEDFSRTVYDRMVFSLSSSAVNAFHSAWLHQAKSLVVINKIHTSKPTVVDDRPIVYNLEHTVGQLCALGLTTTASDIVLHLDQPFRSLADAQRYFELFRTRTFPHGATIEQLKTTLHATEESDYPYLLPVSRHLAIFRIDMPCRAPRQEARRAQEALDRFFCQQGGAKRSHAKERLQ